MLEWIVNFREVRIVFWTLSNIGWKPLTIFTKRSILDIWQGSEYSCGSAQINSLGKEEVQKKGKLTTTFWKIKDEIMKTLIDKNKISSEFHLSLSWNSTQMEYHIDKIEWIFTMMYDNHYLRSVSLSSRALVECSFDLPFFKTLSNNCCPIFGGFYKWKLHFRYK